MRLSRARQVSACIEASPSVGRNRASYLRVRLGAQQATNTISLGEFPMVWTPIRSLDCLIVSAPDRIAPTAGAAHHHSRYRFAVGIPIQHVTSSRCQQFLQARCTRLASRTTGATWAPVSDWRRCSLVVALSTTVGHRPDSPADQRPGRSRTRYGAPPAISNSVDFL